jgi:hypothetical protein
MAQHESQTYSYLIDINDIIVSVSENWKSFAEENLGVSACLPENVIGTSLLDHIHDLETKHLYELILQKVRENKRKATFSFRCDSPDKRRFLELSVIPMKDGFVELKSHIMRTEHRKSVELMRSDIKRSEEYLKICSMCKKIALSETEWEEVEIATKKMKLFELEVLPQLTHGFCQSCANAVMAEFDNEK